MSLSPEGHLRVFTIYRRPADFPDAEFILRGFVVTAGAEPQPTGIIFAADTLEQARSLVPPEADVCIPRDAGDAPHVVESWI